jgi:hypothetical protein
MPLSGSKIVAHIVNECSQALILIGKLDIGARYRLQWSNIAESCRMRRKYVQLYASCLHQSFKVDNQEIRDMEKDLDLEVILLWRSAHLL